ncbi:Serine carboxypeptidase 3 [Balamuthia mandrillaris]
MRSNTLASCVTGRVAPVPLALPLRSAGGTGGRVIHNNSQPFASTLFPHKRSSSSFAPLFRSSSPATTFTSLLLPQQPQQEQQRRSFAAANAQAQPAALQQEQAQNNSREEIMEAADGTITVISGEGVYQLVNRMTPEERKENDRLHHERLELIKKVALIRIKNGTEEKENFLKKLFLTKIRRGYNAGQLYIFVRHQSRKDELYDLLGYNHRSVMEWFTISLLHLWMVMVRLRSEGWRGKQLSQELFTEFWNEVEDSLVEAGADNAIIFGREVKQLNQYYYGTVISLDEALLQRSDTVLVDALYRNVFQTRQHSAQAVERLVRYLRANMAHLDGIDSRLIASGYLPWLDLHEV